jgi:uncharacterized membrane-anchored protein
MPYKNVQIVFFWVVMVVFAAVPIYMIYRYENVLSHGQVYRFRVKPVDPFDAFRGKYVALSYAEDTILPAKGDSFYTYKDEVYLGVGRDKDGFAVLKSVNKKPPVNETYFKGEIGWAGSGREMLHVKFPFDRFYINEPFAEEAEMAYIKASRNAVEDCYAEVAIYKGHGVIKELYISHTPIVQYIKEGHVENRVHKQGLDSVSATPLK